MLIVVNKDYSDLETNEVSIRRQLSDLSKVFERKVLCGTCNVSNVKLHVAMLLLLNTDYETTVEEDLILKSILK